METEDQTEVLSFLERPDSYHRYFSVEDDISVERIDTHGAIVFLVGSFAFKMKRAVYFEYMDFSTLERRKACCEAELVHNRRTSAEIYQKVVPVTRTPSGELAIDGGGQEVEWLVEMRRFDENKVFDRLALKGELDEDLMSVTSDMVCDFFEEIDAIKTVGVCDTIPDIVEETSRQLAEGVPDLFSQEEVEGLVKRQREASARLSEKLDRRRQDGFVRLCHGDLHLRNICMFEGSPRLFDAIEFNDRLAISDILYDLAFLLMDLLHRGLKRHANLVINRYMERFGDYAGLELLPLYLSVRAGIRAFTAVPAAASQSDPAVAQRVRDGAREYLQLAFDFLEPSQPLLVGVGGLSGSGKSTLAKNLARCLPGPCGGVVLRSDVIRKSLFDVEPTEKLGSEGYSPETTKKVYDLLAERASDCLNAGTCVVVDAVHAREGEREILQDIANSKGCPFFGVWLNVDEKTMSDRIEARINDASDADTSVLQKQLQYDPGNISWNIVDGTGDPEAVLKPVLKLIPA